MEVAILNIVSEIEELKTKVRNRSLAEDAADFMHYQTLIINLEAAKQMMMVANASARRMVEAEQEQN